MNVGELKRLIADLPDEYPVLLPAFDHDYARVRSAKKQVVELYRGRYGEYYDEQSMLGGLKSYALVISPG